MEKIHFDYMAGAHPEILRRLTETNLFKTAGYGYDDYTRSAEKLILKECGLTKGRVHFLVGGTQTNATVIDGLLHQYEKQEVEQGERLFRERVRIRRGRNGLCRKRQHVTYCCAKTVQVGNFKQFHLCRI